LTAVPADRKVGEVLPRQVTPRLKAPKPAKKAAKRLKPKRATTTAALKRQALTKWGAVIHLKYDACQFCGRRDGKLDAHHIVDRGYAATFADSTNGVLLCATHHTLGLQSVHRDSQFAVNLYSLVLGVEGYAALNAKAYAGVRANRAFWEGEIAKLDAELVELGLRHV